MVELNESFDFEQDGKVYNLYNLPDGFVIKGNLRLIGLGLTELPDLSKVRVEGDFVCRHNKLTSLKGSPKEVKGDFDCQNNQLTSLEGAPEEVKGDFDCNNNKLTSLKGAPKKVGAFNCAENELTSLLGGPTIVRAYYDCSDNRLTNLQGAPEKIGTRFSCENNLLTSLHDLPSEIEMGVRADRNLIAKYIDIERDYDKVTVSFESIKNSSLYQEEKLISSKTKELRNKILRTVAAENVSPEKGVTNPKRSKAEKQVINTVLENIGRDMNK